MNSRLLQVKKTLTKNQLDAMIISSVPNITYLTDYSGFSKEEREAYLLITQNENIIFTDGRYSEAIKQHVKDFSLQLIKPKTSFVSLLENYCTKNKLHNIGFEENDLSVSEYIKIADIVNSTLRLLAAQKIIDEIRMFKTDDEILNIRKACELGDKTFTYLLTKITLGITEKELAAELEYFIKKQNADISFRPIVAFGANSAIPHHQTNDQRLKTNDFILLDFGVRINNYCSDMTRTVFFGKPTTEQKHIHETVKKAQQKAIEYFNQEFGKKQENSDKRKKQLLTARSVSASKADIVARDYIVSQGFPSIPHSLGHGIGLEVHESPRLGPKSKDILQEGMVFSIEPGIYLPGYGGVRIEDLFTIQNNKLVQLTNSPKDFIEMGIDKK